MTRSTDFGATVKRGARAVQRSIVVHVCRDSIDGGGPLIGLVISKSVGPAVIRHRVARRLRHVARRLVDDLDADERVVIRALPGCRDATSTDLEMQLRAGLDRAHTARGLRR